jgi:predicted small lipoprotein YifL
MRGVLVAVLLALALSACGKRGAPSPPGPADQITWPKIYPSQ